MKPLAIRLMAQLVIAVCVLAGGRLAAAEVPLKPADAPKVKLPPELDVIPRDSMSVISLRMAAFRDNKPGQWLFDMLTNDPSFKQLVQAGGAMGVGTWADIDKKMADEMGVDGSTVERVTIVLGKIDIAKLQNQADNFPSGSVVSLSKPYDRAKVLKAMVPAGKEEKQGAHTYHFDKAKHLAVYFLNDRSFVMGTEASIKEFLSQPAVRPKGPMSDVLQLATESAFVLHMNPETLGPIGGAFALAAPLPEPGATMLRQFLDLKGLTLCMDIDERLRLDLLLSCANERDQKAVVETMDKGLDLSRQKLAPLLGADAPKEVAPYIPLLKGTDAALKRTEIRQEGLHLHIPLHIRPDNGKAAMKPAVALNDKRLDEIWTGLTRQGIVGMRGSYHDAHALASAPEQTLKLLKERLKPSPAMDAAERKTIEDRLNDLDSDEFAKREQATAELIKLGSRARPMVQARLDGELGSLEVRRRLERIMERMKADLSPEQHRELRALEVLEQIGTPEARELLRSIAAGEPGAPITREAKKKLARMK